MVAGLLASVPLEQQPRRQKAKRHAVAAVSEREQVLRVIRMRSDVRQTVGRRGEQPFPRDIDIHLLKSRIAPLEVLPDACRSIP
jgi:hypothetical protein